LDKLKATNPKHQTQTLYCHFLAVSLFFVSLVKNSLVVSWQSNFCLLFKLIKIADLLSVGAVAYKLAQVLSNNLISERLV